MNKKLFLGIIFVLFSVFCLLNSKPSLAQLVTKLEAIPPRLELTVEKGEAAYSVLKVRNGGDSEQAVVVKIQDFVVQDDKGTPVPVEEQVSGRWAASTWVAVSPAKFVIKPGELKQLDLTVVVPDDALAGGHYAVVFYEPVQGIQIEGTKSAVALNVGTLVYITVPGPITENAFVSRMDLPKFSEYGPIPITTEIENLSDIHIQPVGAIEIYNWLGKLNSTLALEEGKNIFPGKSRIYENTWPQKWGFGKYKAYLKASYGTQGNILTATVFFWIIPWRVMAMVALLVLIGVLLFIYFRKKSEKPILETEKSSFSEE